MKRRQDATGASTRTEPAAEVDWYASQVIAAAVEVHRVLGAGFVESVYEHALCAELELRSVPFRRQVSAVVDYKGHRVGESQLDLLVGERLVVELKAVEALAAVHAVQLRSYLKATGCVLGLLINFNVSVLLRGVRRIVSTT